MFSSLIPTAPLAGSVSETLHREYRLAETQQACPAEVIPVCSVHPTELNTRFLSLAVASSFQELVTKVPPGPLEPWDRKVGAEGARRTQTPPSEGGQESHSFIHWVPCRGEQAISPGPCSDLLRGKGQTKICWGCGWTGQCWRLMPHALGGRNCIPQRGLSCVGEVARDEGGAGKEERFSGKGNVTAETQGQ